MSSRLISRIAPTPSGYLHLGNLANFIFTQDYIKGHRGTLWLRIDDCDGTRVRSEYVDHIFESLAFMGIDWERGPRNRIEFETQFSQNQNKQKYFDHLKSIQENVYACSCSRSDIGSKAYPGTCRKRNLNFIPGETSLRFIVDDEELAKEFGDIVLWRKDNGPAYHLVSVIDDLEMKVNLIVRGQDLEASSRLQRFLAFKFDGLGFSEVKFIHHPLLVNQTGEKLSKSRGDYSLIDMRSKGISAEQIREDIKKCISTWNF